MSGIIVLTLRSCRRPSAQDLPLTSKLGRYSRSPLMIRGAPSQPCRECAKFRTSRMSPLLRQRYVTTRRTARSLFRSATPAKHLLENDLFEKAVGSDAHKTAIFWPSRGKTQKAAPRGTAFPLSANNGLNLRAGQPRQRGSHSSGLPLAAYNNETFDHLLPVVNSGADMGVVAEGSRISRR